jgi:hypothetical protein
VIDQIERFGGVGRRDQQGMIAPGAVVGEFDALLALGVGPDEGAIGIQDRFLKELGGLLRSDSQPCLREMPLEEMEVEVDVADQADPACQSHHGADAAGTQTLDAIGPFVVNSVSQPAAPSSCVEPFYPAESKNSIGFNVHAQSALYRVLDLIPPLTWRHDCA